MSPCACVNVIVFCLFVLLSVCVVCRVAGCLAVYVCVLVCLPVRVGVCCVCFNCLRASVCVRVYFVCKCVCVVCVLVDKFHGLFVLFI